MLKSANHPLLRQVPKRYGHFRKHHNQTDKWEYGTTKLAVTTSFNTYIKLILLI
jgi:hypothetical protein